MTTIYQLMYRDIPVIEFDTNTCSAHVVHPSALPLSIRNVNADWDKIRNFCSNRILLMNRMYCKEILSSCNISDQSDIGVCIIGRALSFRDNYWIKNKHSDEKWADANLYNNEFNLKISRTAITGKTEVVSINDAVYTGELTGLGTRAKCFERRTDGIYLVKNESLQEIFGEVYGYNIEKALNLSATKYSYEQYMGLDCSVCKLSTSDSVELIPARDILQYANSQMKIETEYYKIFMEADPENFIKMQIFDYVTLNTDRNRDNFGLKRENGKIVGLYPVFDNDSCFKGKNTDAHYFVSGLTFKETLHYLQNNYHEEYKRCIPDVKNMQEYVQSSEWKELFTAVKSKEEYNSLLLRCKEASEFSKNLDIFLAGDFDDL